MLKNTSKYPITGWAGESDIFIAQARTHTHNLGGPD